FLHFEALVRLMGLASLAEYSRVGAEPHRAAQVRDAVLLVEQTNDRLPAIAVHFGAVGILQAHDIPCELYDGALQAKTDSEERHAAFPGIADCFDLPGDAAFPEAAGDEDAVHAA